MSDIFIRHKNEDAEGTLVIPVQMLINTPYDVLKDHILENSKNCKDWLVSVPPHDGVALLCGSGVSIKEHLREIRGKQHDGAVVFALNAASDYLASNGIMPDNQVIIDAKEETSELVGAAKEHLFAATVHQKCFKLRPNAKLFQLQVEDESLQDQIDEIAPYDYTMLMTAVSVGIVSLALVYAMGYRKIYCYGYDSSYTDGNSHVVPQPMNGNIPCMNVDFAGKSYLTSLPMKMQAERFMSVANSLKKDGCEINVIGSGLLPDMSKTAFEELTEKDKYTRMWSMLSYRDASPAERIVDLIDDKIKKGVTIDFGCGTGRAAALLSKSGRRVILLDFAPNCRDQEADGLEFLEVDLTQPIHVLGDSGYCIDVMEHIPPEDVDKVINNIMASVPECFFQISTVPDVCGATIGHELHLTIESPRDWFDRFKRLGFTVDWMDNTALDVKLLVKRKEENA